MISRRSLFRGVVAAASIRRAVAQAGDAVRVVIDSDAANGIDDQFALAYALLAPDVMSVEAIYAAPFVTNAVAEPTQGMEASFEEIERVLGLVGGNDATPVLRGATSFLPGPWQAVDSPAARDLIERAKAGPARLYVVAIGPATNVSSAILLDPSIKDRVNVIWLGGQPYDSSSASEYNLEQDVHASRVLYESSVRFVNIPVDGISDQITVTAEEVGGALEGQSKIGDYLVEIFSDPARQHDPSTSPSGSKVLWDVAAVAYLINPGWVRTNMVSSPILNADLTWTHDTSRFGVRVATEVNREGIVGDLFERLARAE